MNLLPEKEKEILKKGLKIRFIITALILLTSSFVVGAVMLLPGHFLAKGYALETELESYSNEGNSQEILKLPTEIDSKLKFFQSQTSSVSSIGTLVEVLSYKPSGITINSLSFLRDQPREEKVGTVVLIAGVARDRNVLVSFENALTGSGSFSSVALPVSSLTKEKNLPFSVNIFIEQK